MIKKSENAVITESSKEKPYTGNSFKIHNEMLSKKMQDLKFKAFIFEII